MLFIKLLSVDGNIRNRSDNEILKLNSNRTVVYISLLLGSLYNDTAKT